MPKRKAARISGDDNGDIAADGSSLSDVQGNDASQNLRKQDPALENINKMSIETFEDLYVDAQWLSYAPPEPTPAEAKYNISLKSAATLSEGEQQACFNLIKVTSKEHYEGSSWGWHPKRKRKEMQEEEMRYLLVRQPGTEKGVEGFLSFMLTHDSSPSVPVLYVYEIHLRKSLRSLGLGRHVMHVAEGIAQKVGVDKIMLTCFISNAQAHEFYKRRGYATDECSPEDRKTRKKTVKVDYVIMSKRVVDLQDTEEAVSNKRAVRSHHNQASSSTSQLPANASDQAYRGPRLAADVDIAIQQDTVKAAQPAEISKKASRNKFEVASSLAIEAIVEDLIAKRQADLDEREKELEATEQALEKREEELDEMENQLYLREGEIEDREDTFNSKVDDHDEREEDLKEREKAVEQGDKDNKELLDQLSAVEKQQNERAAQLKGWADELEKQDKDQDAHGELLTTQAQLYDRVEDSVHTQIQRCKDIMGRCETWEDELEATEKRLDEREKHLDDRAQGIDDLQQQMSELQDQMHATQRRLQQQMDRLNEAIAIGDRRNARR